jgi:hypothetical protein
MKIRELLTEDQTLSIPKLLKDIGRFNRLVMNIKGGQPLYLVDGTPVIIKPSEGDALVKLHKSGQLDVKGQRLGLTAKDGKVYPLSSFLKTVEYGGMAVPPGQEKTAPITKEGLKLKPSEVGLAEQNITAGTLGKVLAVNTVLQSSEVGKVVIDLAKQISAGQNPQIPKDLDPKAIPAINDNAGEYLGVWALIKGISDFPNRDKFLKWLNAPLESLTLFFPSKQNTSIADSYALVDPESGHQINISSKGRAGGAPPSITGLKIPDSIRKKKQYAGALAFMDIIQTKKLQPGIADTIAQPFYVMNMIAKVNPKAIPSKFNKFLPFTPETVTMANNSVSKKAPLPNKYTSLWSDIEFTKDSTDGGKMIHAVKVAVKDIINAGAIPNFEAAVLEILDYNFIQQYTTITKGVMTFRTQWPAKVDGKITVETKSGATDPTKGSFSFKLSFK